MSQFFASGCLSIETSTLAPVLPMNIQYWFLSDGLVGYPYCPRDSKESSPTPQFKSINPSVLSFLYSSSLTSTNDYWKNYLTRQTFFSKVISLLLNMLSRLVIAFLLRSNHLLISRLQSPSAVILEPKKIKFVMFSIVSPSICNEVVGLDAKIYIIL